MLKNEPEIDEELEEKSLYEIAPKDGEPKEVSYNPDIPIETFDFIITDECHRSIYNLWRQVLDYFDAFLIGLTATPDKRTFGFFNENVVSQYTYEESVTDGVNVPYDVYSIETDISKKGEVVKAGWFVDRRDKLTRKKRRQQEDEDTEYSKNEIFKRYLHRLHSHAKRYSFSLFSKMRDDRYIRKTEKNRWMVELLNLELKIDDGVGKWMTEVNGRGFF